MTDLTPITVLVNHDIADDVRKKKVLEVILREKDARYKANIKCAVVNAGNESKGTKEILNSALNALSEKNSSIEQINHTVRNFDKNIHKADGHIVALSDQIKNMSSNVDSIFKSANMIKAMSFLNAGLSMANLAVSIVGFAIISHHLNRIDGQLTVITKKIDDVKNLEKNELVQEFHKITMNYNSLSDDIAKGNNDLLRQENFLIETNSFLSKLKANIMDKSLKISDLLEMIYSLIVPYTVILNSFVTAYYFENQKLPSNYKSFTEIYDSLLDDSYLDAVERYWFLDCDQTNHDTYLTIDAMMLLTIQCDAEIIDQVELVKEFNTREKFERLNEAINETMRQEAKEDASKIADRLHISPEDCTNVLLGALS